MEPSGISPHLLQRVAGLKALWTPGFFHCRPRFQTLMYGQPVLHVKAGSPSFSRAPGQARGLTMALSLENPGRKLSHSNEALEA